MIAPDVAVIFVLPGAETGFATQCLRMVSNQIGTSSFR